MSLEAIADRRYGPFSYRAGTEKVAEFVAATGDDPDRWRLEAPPALASALLFVVAPHLLADPDAEGSSVIHGEQTFEWSGPIPLETDLAVSGRVSKLRIRSGVAYVGFDLEVAAGSETVLTGSSTFLMSEGSPPAGDSEEELEPAPEAGSDLAVAEPRPAPDVGAAIEPLRRSASRADLVRYAGASRDWNPIHWDHEAAVAAGLPGVVVHGLLQSAWVLQAVQRHTTTPASSARFRYRSPLRPAAPAVVTGTRTDTGFSLEMATDPGRVSVVGTVSVRE